MRAPNSSLQWQRVDKLERKLDLSKIMKITGYMIVVRLQLYFTTTSKHYSPRRKIRMFHN